MKSLQSELLKKFRSRWKSKNYSFVNSQAIQDWEHENIPHPKGKAVKYKHDTISRTLRTMAEENLIDRMEEGSVFYKYHPTEHDVMWARMQNI